KYLPTGSRPPACPAARVPWWDRNSNPTPLRVTARVYSLLIEPVRQRLLPQLTLLYFLLPRPRIALQRLKIAVGRAQEALPAIAVDGPVQNRLHRRLFLFRQLPQQLMRVRADADVWRAAVGLHSGIIACVRRRIHFCIRNVLLARKRLRGAARACLPAEHRQITPRTAGFQLPPRSSPHLRPYSSPVRLLGPTGNTRRSSGTPQPAPASRSRWCCHAEESRSRARDGSHHVCIRRNSLCSPFPESRLPLIRLRLIRRHYYARARPGIPSDNYVNRTAVDEPE